MSHHLFYRVSHPQYRALSDRSKTITQPNLMFTFGHELWSPLIVRLEVFDWLEEMLGKGEFNPIANYDWKRSSKKRYSYRMVDYNDIADHIFEFKYRNDAMLFKLAFAG